MAEEVVMVFKDYTDSLRETLKLTEETNPFFYPGCVVASMISTGVWDLRDSSMCKCCPWWGEDNDENKYYYEGCCRPSTNGAI